jgi:hypothetical protein
MIRESGMVFAVTKQEGRQTYEKAHGDKISDNESSEEQRYAMFGIVPR